MKKFLHFQRQSSSSNQQNTISSTTEKSNLLKRQDSKHYKSKSDPSQQILTQKQVLRKKYQYLVLNSEYDEEILDQQIISCFVGMKYLKNLLQVSTKTLLEIKQIMLPQKDKEKSKTLFLDLDETLVHTKKQTPTQKSSLELEKSQQSLFQVHFRPFCRYFIKEMSKLYELYIFTASQYDYAQKIVNLIDPKKKYIDGIISRECCLETKNGIKIKDLKIIQNRNIEEIILIDNLVQSFGSSLENGIPILSWQGDSKDRELFFLAEFLKEISQKKDVRPLIREKYKLKEFLEEKQDILNLLDDKNCSI